MAEYRIGDYVTTLYNGFAADGVITGKHGSADYYAIRLNDNTLVYRWAEDIKPSVRDSEFVAVVNLRAALRKAGLTDTRTEKLTTGHYGVFVNHDYTGLYPDADALKKHATATRIADALGLRSEKRGHCSATLIYCA